MALILSGVLFAVALVPAHYAFGVPTILSGILALVAVLLRLCLSQLDAIASADEPVRRHRSGAQRHHYESAGLRDLKSFH
jgi:hypothetical protein